MSVCLYIPLFFCLRGNIVEAEDKRWWRVRFRRQVKAKLSADDNAEALWDSASFRERRRSSRGAAKEAFNMLLSVALPYRVDL